MAIIHQKTVFVGMSGGVDSSVTALLLQRRGYRVIGVFLRCYNIDGCAERDAEDARRVAEHIGIPFYVWDFEDEYKRRVVEYMVRGYRAGITPNPDVMCNREIKFGLFLEKARAMGADYVATGHYVRLSKTGKGTHVRHHLFAAEDQNKDQSYFLWTLTQNDLRHCLFPIGDYSKPSVREIARKAGLPTAEKKDSQGICFLGKVSVEEFLKQYIPEKPGDIVTLSGEKIGEHNGVYFYTIGQRHGLHLAAKNRTLNVHGKTATAAHYVAAKDVKTNTLIVAEGALNEALHRTDIRITLVNLIADLPFGKPLSVRARVRYRQPATEALLTLSRNPSDISGTLVFLAPQRFVAEGQSAVFYSVSGEMLGGGVIQ